MSRKLVTVRRVGTVQPIPGADRIQLATVDGWAVVVKVGEFAPNDRAIFFEIDSYLPGDDPRWGFLEVGFTVWNEMKGYKIKTAKLKGQISQGILRTLNDFPEVAEVIKDLEEKHGVEKAEEMVRGMSFAEALGVKKYEPPEPGSNVPGERPARPFPSFVQKTDQERIQNLPGVFAAYADEVFQETTKMDGSSMTVYYLREDSQIIETMEPVNPIKEPTVASMKGRFGVCSRNIDLLEAGGGNFWAVARKNKLPEKLSNLNRNYAIQGELCGSSIQKNFEGFQPGFHEFFVFSVWDIDKQQYLEPKAVEELAAELNLKHVPVNGYYKLGDIATEVKALLARAEGKGINGKKREGIVLKQVDGPLSFKAISNSYLLKHGE
ncbi:hypothetical protein TWF694_005104 [Orbilia ellipsospora]|uniref:RNA ligase domain-containing protein n=1 Tax=Orbilia ellipsospora TaxID=2528407 RepID=A0AAV9WUK9_9PEZI